MGWLVPLYLAGLTALSLPLVFHLVRRTPRGRQQFSSLMFLSPTPPQLTRRSRLDQLLLLCLRLLALALLALAFTRPFLRETAAFSPIDLPGRRVALLVDTSASMRRGDLWREALRLAEKQLDELNPQDDVALYGFNDRLERLVDFETSGAPAIAAKAELVRQQLKAIEPGWGATDLGTALVVVAGEMDSASDVNQAVREPLLVVISDFQKGARIDALQGFEWPKHVFVVLRPVTSAKPTNAFAQVLPNDEDRGDAEARVRVMNAPDSTAEQFHLTWSADPAKALRPAEVAVYVPAGQSRVVRLPRTIDSLEADRILLRGDDHPFDNTFFVVPPRKQTATVLYAGTDAADDVQGMQYYLRLAVANDPLRQIDVQAINPANAFGGLKGDSLRLIVLTKAVMSEAQKELRSFVEAGGTLLCVPGTRETELTIASLFDDKMLVPTPERVQSEYLLLRDVDFTHPLFAPFVGPRYGDFTKIHFWKHWAVEPPSETRTLARFDNGDPALLERLLGKGRILVLTSGWNPQVSQFALSSKFVPFIASLLDLACGEAKVTARATIHETVALPAESDGSQIVVRPPGGKPISLDSGATTFSATDLPGIYSVLAGTSETRFAVNLAAGESNTAPLELEQLEQRGVRLGSAASRSERIDRLRQERDIELESRQKVWRWLIAAAVGVLLLETWLAGRAEGKLRRRVLAGHASLTT
jgi:hypothetical protein